LQEVWAAVSEKEAVVAGDERALETAKAMLQRHRDEAADDAAPLK
jgi:hypothetical protein